MGFGKTVRKLREERGLTIAELADRVGMSPTYLAPIEREVFLPPAEDKVVRIARALRQDPDEFLALAGRIATDVERSIRKRPTAMARLVRAAGKLAPDRIEDLAARAEEGRARRGRAASR